MCNQPPCQNILHSLLTGASSREKDVHHSTLCTKPCNFHFNTCHLQWYWHLFWTRSRWPETSWSTTNFHRKVHQKWIHSHPNHSCHERRDAQCPAWQGPNSWSHRRQQDKCVSDTWHQQLSQFGPMHSIRCLRNTVKNLQYWPCPRPVHLPPQTSREVWGMLQCNTRRIRERGNIQQPTWLE